MTFKSLHQKVDEWITKFSNISNNKELEKAIKESMEEINSAISNLEAKYIKPKNPLNESEKLEKVMEELKGSLLPPSKESSNKRDRSEPDELIFKHIKHQQSELIEEIKNLSEWIDKNNCQTLNKGNKLGKNECLAFTYYGCGGNRNRFKSRHECISQCGKNDGSICALNSYPIRGIVLTNTADRNCNVLTCPSGFQCKQGWSKQSAVCCNSALELIYSNAHSGKGLCLNGAPLLQNGRIVVGDSCSKYRCPPGYDCIQNRFFANCCPSTRSVPHRFKRDINFNDIDDSQPTWLKSGKFQGDIAGFDQQSFKDFIQRLNLWQEQSLSPSKNDRYNSAVSNPRRLWDNGRVPYIIDSNDSELLNAVSAAIQIFYDSTCIRFIPHTDEPNYIRIIDTAIGCWSYMGNLRQGSQDVSLEGCKDTGSVLHELMHAIGFWHEQQRTDRDNHIIVIEDNIEPSKIDQYSKAETDKMLLIGRYDMDSVMHYSSNAFARRGRRTMRAKYSNRVDFGGESLTDEDIRKIRILYKCDEDSLPSKCPNTVTRYYTIDGVSTPICAVIYDQSNCGGKWFQMPVWWKDNLLEKQKYGGGNWHNAISSAEVNPGCALKMCTSKSYEGDCIQKEGGKTGRNVLTLGHPYDDGIASLWCSCGADSDEDLSEANDPVYHNLRWGVALPSNAPSNVGGFKTCALAVDKFSLKGWYHWLQNGSTDRDRNQHSVFAYSYLITRESCTLYYCDKADFAGQCYTLGPYLHTNGYGFYNLKSYRCTCND